MAGAPDDDDDDDDDDMPPLVGEDGEEVADAAAPAAGDAHQGDDLPPLVGEDGEQVAGAAAPAAGNAQGDGGGEGSKAAGAAAPAAGPCQGGDGGGGRAAADGGDAEGPLGGPGRAEAIVTSRLPEGVSQDEALRATAALQAAAALRAASGGGPDSSAAGPVSAASAIQGLLAETKEPEPERKELDDVTKRMVEAICRDDFEECEDAIMQGADVHVDCSGGMRALHMSALRGEMFLTELLIAHGADVNVRDLAGNTPLLYTCHFYRQHGRGTQLVSQLLYHKADPHYRCKDGKMAGKSAYDIMEKCSREPNRDENAPRNMCAMLQLAMDGSESGYEAIAKVWMQHKSENKKLYTVSSKRDNYDYAMKNIKWETPENAKNAQASQPVRLNGDADSILEEKFTYLKDYSFNDEGDKVKVYVTFPDGAAGALGDKGALQVDFELEALDLKLRTAMESFRLRVEPLYGTIDVEQCKHRVSASSGKVTLTLAKRHKNRRWPGIQKPR